LESLNDIGNLKAMEVLNASRNQIRSLDELKLARQRLKALILSENCVQRLPSGMIGFQSIRTLVLSHNDLEDLTPLEPLTTLVKLSCSHNRVRKLPDTSRWTQLQELRLAHNRITSLPSAQQWSNHASRLTILDLGHNLVQSWEGVGGGVQVLAALTALRNLTLRGNPVAKSGSGVAVEWSGSASGEEGLRRSAGSTSAEGSGLEATTEAHYRERVRRVAPKLRILDGKRLDGPGRRGRGGEQRGRHSKDCDEPLILEGRVTKEHQRQRKFQAQGRGPRAR